MLLRVSFDRVRGLVGCEKRSRGEGVILCRHPQRSGFSGWNDQRVVELMLRHGAHMPRESQTCPPEDRSTKKVRLRRSTCCSHRE